MTTSAKSTKSESRNITLFIPLDESNEYSGIYNFTQSLKTELAQKRYCNVVNNFPGNHGVGNSRVILNIPGQTRYALCRALFLSIFNRKLEFFIILHEFQTQGLFTKTLSILLVLVASKTLALTPSILLQLQRKLRILKLKQDKLSVILQGPSFKPLDYDALKENYSNKIKYDSEKKVFKLLVIGELIKYSPPSILALIELVNSSNNSRIKYEVSFVGSEPKELSRDLHIIHNIDNAKGLNWLGNLPANDLLNLICISDLSIATYVDGLSLRRSSAILSLTNGCPIITTTPNCKFELETIENAKLKGIYMYKKLDYTTFVKCSSSIVEEMNLVKRQEIQVSALKCFNSNNIVSAIIA